MTLALSLLLWFLPITSARYVSRETIKTQIDPTTINSISLILIEATSLNKIFKGL